jgi:hypothetical protein
MREYGVVRVIPKFEDILTWTKDLAKDSFNPGHFSLTYAMSLGIVNKNWVTIESTSQSAPSSDVYPPGLTASEIFQTISDGWKQMVAGSDSAIDYHPATQNVKYSKDISHLDERQTAPRAQRKSYNEENDAKAFQFFSTMQNQLKECFQPVRSQTQGGQ